MSNHRPRSAVAAAMAAIFAGLSAAQAAGQAPSFADYPAAARFTGRNAAPVLTTREARLFRTMIRNGARQKPNFNGHYIVTIWGCGTDCNEGAIIDAISGRVVMLPVVAGSVDDADWDLPHQDYRLDSRLFVIKGMIGEQPPAAIHYFAFDGRNLTPLKTIAKPEKP